MKMASIHGLLTPDNFCTFSLGKYRSNSPPPELKIVLLEHGFDDGDAVDLCLILDGEIVLVEKIAEFETRVFLMFETAFAEPLTHLVSDAETAVEDLLGCAAKDVVGADSGVVAALGREDIVHAPCRRTVISRRLQVGEVFDLKDAALDCTIIRSGIGRTQEQKHAGLFQKLHRVL